MRRDEEHVVAEPEELSAIGYDEGGLSEVLGLTGIGQQAGAHSGRRSERTVGSPVCPAFCACHRSLKRLSQEDQAGLASAGKSHRWVNRDCRFAHAAARLTPIGTFIGSDRFPQTFVGLRVLRAQAQARARALRGPSSWVATWTSCLGRHPRVRSQQGLPRTIARRRLRPSSRSSPDASSRSRVRGRDRRPSRHRAEGVRSPAQD